MEQAYALALWQIVSNSGNPKRAVASLRRILATHDRMALLPKIARAFERIAEREMRRNRLVLSVAHDKETHRVKRMFKSLFSHVGIDAKTIYTCIDDTLIGGWRLEGREQLVDMSYKKYLLELYNRIIRS